MSPPLLFLVPAIAGRRCAACFGAFGAMPAVHRVLAEGVGAVAVLVVQRLAEDLQALLKRRR
jgi:hypothetical protein